MGHKYYEENLLAIARLRGYSLKLLAFPKNDIASDDEYWHKGDTITLVSLMLYISRERVHRNFM